MKSGRITAAAALLSTILAAPASAQDVTMETLLDRIQVDDLLTPCYHDLANGGHVLSEYFTEDALLDVDGKWLISKRYISSDSGTPDRFDATSEPRGNPLAD